ncbi:MAG: hypothetical protein MMC33_009473 [Icmadophila ericetorum]|nr:hypothetical protein [Icmadophila ericetorum]
MARESISLMKYLKLPNPAVNSDHSWLGGTTSTPAAHIRLRASDIVEWEDFNLETLCHIYGRILELPADDLPDFARHLPFHLSEIKDEDSLEALLIRWNNAVVSCALSVAQRADIADGHGGSRLNAEEIYMARGGHACLPTERKNQRGFRPDWAGIIPGKLHRGTKRQSYINLLPGDTKLSSKWESTGKCHRSNEFQKPWRQIFRYCLFAKVRYGYLLTQEELVVVRISTKSGPTDGKAPAVQRPQRRLHPELMQESAIQEVQELHEKHKGMMAVEGDDAEPVRGFLEYKSIPWKIPDGNPDGELSINLALWWLHMMASKSRSIETDYMDLREEYQSLNQVTTGSSNHRESKYKGKKRARNSHITAGSSKGEMEPPRKLQRSFSGPMQVE